MGKTGYYFTTLVNPCLSMDGVAPTPIISGVVKLVMNQKPVFLYHQISADLETPPTGLKSEEMQLPI